MSTDPFAGTSKTEETQNENAKENTESTSGKSKTSTRGKSTSMAYRGKPVDINYDATTSFDWGNQYHDDFEPYQGTDYNDLRHLNQELIKTVRSSDQVKRALNEARRQETEAQGKYRTEYNRCLIGLSGGTEASRKAVAEVMCESLYSEYLVAQALVEELKNNYFSLKNYLDVLNTLSNNMRAEMRLV